MPPLKLFNTLSRKKEIFKPVRKDWVGLYTCGPTVYDHAHIGNLRSYIFADVLRRVLKYNGYKVHWVMNITDVDDKTIKRTVDEFGSGATVDNLQEYTDKYLASFKEDLKKLNIPTSEPDIKFIRVSEKIHEIKDFIKKLIKLGYAYKTNDGVYFSIEKYQKKFGDYGSLVGENFLDGKKSGVRVKVDEYEKENLSDFALWKGRDPSDGNIFWQDSELDEGRPGWHIECSVINNEGFGGKPTDIHTGGVDLIFPHHTNEIAQSQPIYKPFVKFWLHNEHLLIDGKKMAKSEKNFFTLKDIEERDIHPLYFRYLILGAHYRSKLNFTWESLNGSQIALSKINDRSFEFHKMPDYKSSSTVELKNKFSEVMNDDLNTPKWLGLFHEALKPGVFSKEEQLNILRYFNDVLGFAKLTEPIPAEVHEKFEEYKKFREKLKKAPKNDAQFMQSDALRKEIEALGYSIRDTKQGSYIVKRFF